MGGSKGDQTSRPANGNQVYDRNNDGGYLPPEEESQHTINRNKLKEKINLYRSQRKQKQNRIIKVIKRPKNVFQAMYLPKILNLNPRSATNKIDHIKTFIEEEEIDIAFISESHDRENKRLEDHFKLDSHIVISNLYQRSTREKGGRPAIIANVKKYHIENLTNTSISIPWGVEMTWALLTPKNASKDSVIKKFF